MIGSGKGAEITFFMLTVFLIGLMLPPSAFSDTKALEVETIETAGIVVRYEKPLSAAAREIADAYPTVRQELTKLLHWEIRFRPEVILIKDNKTFAMLAPGDWVVAFADPERQRIVIDHSRMGTHPFKLDVTLKHELSHLLLHTYIPSGLPRWFDEGVCQWVTGGLAEILVEDTKPVLKETALAGRLLRFDDLSARFPGDRKGIILAYEQSRSLVEYIAETYGTLKLLEMLNALKTGSTMDDAVKNNLGLTMGELERAWALHLNKSITWLIYISNNLYEILFFLAALMTIIAAVKILLRRVARKTSEDEEEEE
jgi:hypothetical protein